MRYAIVLAFGFSVIGCSGDGGLGVNGPDLAVPGDMVKPPDLTRIPDLSAVVDLTRPRDLVMPEPRDADGVGCGNMITCQIGESCCVAMVMGQWTGTCMASCPDGGVAVMCDGPEDCGGNACCGDVKNMNLMPQVNGVTCTNAPSACDPMLSLQGGTTRLCHTDADCTAGLMNPQYPSCCSATYNGQTVHFCLNQLIAGLAMGLVTCP